MGSLNAVPMNEIVTGKPSLVMPAGTIRSGNPVSLAMMVPEPSPARADVDVDDPAVRAVGGEEALGLALVAGEDR